LFFVDLVLYLLLTQL